MTILSGLKLIQNLQKPRSNGIHSKRNKLATRLDEQIEIARAKRDGVRREPHRCMKTVKNSVTGQKVLVEGYKTVRAWFWPSVSGTYCFNIRYGSKIIELAKGKDTVEVSDLSALVDALLTMKSAVLAGELDVQIEVISGSLRSCFRSKA